MAYWRKMSMTEYASEARVRMLLSFNQAKYPENTYERRFNATNGKHYVVVLVSDPQINEEKTK